MGWRNRRSYSGGYGDWAPYVPVAERRRQAARKIAAMTKKGEKVSPIVIEGRTIAATFWGKAWCNNLESYMDFANRLPRGRTYVRNGSVVDLKITPGKVNALVSGSSIYTVEIAIKPLEAPRWQDVIKSCAGKIDSLVELLQGKLSKGVMETVTSKEQGLFPAPEQILLKCSCPDSATMCKHVAATLYGVGSRLDNQPELLFLLRQVDHMELITKASVPTAIDKAKTQKGKMLETSDLGSMFGIELESGSTPPTTKAPGDQAKANKGKDEGRKAAAKKVTPRRASTLGGNNYSKVKKKGEKKAKGRKSRQ